MVARYLILCLISILVSAAQSETETDKLGKAKLQKIEALESESSGGIINFTEKQYYDLVAKNPRPYDVVLFWNLPNGQCDHCTAAENEFAQTTYSFLKARGSGNKDVKHNEKKVFFGTFYFSKDKRVQNVFKQYNLMTVPYLTVSEMDLKRDGKPETFFKSENKWKIENAEIYDAQKQIDFINNSLRTDVQISFTFLSIMIKNLIGLFVIFFFFQVVQYAYETLLKQWVWFGISIVVFIVCTGGLVYSMINDTPLFKFERNEYGSVVIGEYFMRGSRGQWKGEGWLISTLVTFTGLIWLYLNNIEKFAQSKSSQRIIIYIALATIWICQQLLVVAYRIKSSWYNPSFMPPDYYGTGSLMQDQGNNI